MNDKYYRDIKKFPLQFSKGLELAGGTKVDGDFDRIILCGMGGSSFFVHLINDLLAQLPEVKFKVEAVKDYSLPKNSDSNALYILSSVSGNTEEVLSCFDQVEARGYRCFVLTAGGELLNRANSKKIPTVVVPLDTQPRLLTGYLIAVLLKVLVNSALLDYDFDFLTEIFSKLDENLDEQYAKDLAKDLFNSVPIVIGSENNSSAALFTKIKFNENSKIPSYWNIFPEINHNEMVGYTNMLLPAHFLILKSKFSHPRIHKRIEVFKTLFQSKGNKVTVIELKGDSVPAEIFNMHYLADHITYYLANEYNIDPEPVAMVEEFKGLLNR